MSAARPFASHEGALGVARDGRDMKRLFLIAAMFFAPALCWAQNTTVTATVTDPNMQPYAFSTGYAALVCPGNQAPTYNGYTIPRTFTITGFDGTGTFVQLVYDVSVIQPTGCGYQWHITFKDGVTNFITGTITSVTGSAVNESSAISAFAVLLPPPPVTTPPGGSSGQLQYNNSGTFGGAVGSSVAATGAITLTAGADTTKPLTINSHSSTQSVSLLDVNNQSSISADTPFTLHGLGLGSFSPGAAKGMFHIGEEATSTSGFAWVVTNHTADVAKGAANITLLETKMSDTGIAELCGGAPPADGNNQYSCFTWGNNLVGGSGNETIIARCASGCGFTTIVPFAAGAVASQSADIFDVIDSGNNVLTGFDKGGNPYAIERTAPMGVSGRDIFWPDSTVHRWGMLNNAGSEFFLTGIGTAGVANDFAILASDGYDIADSGIATTGIVQRICFGQIALSTSAINSGTRATNTLSCSGLSASTDSVVCAFSGDTNAVTGYAPSASGSLILKPWVSANTINVDQVNNTSGSITPGAATVNCKGIR